MVAKATQNLFDVNIGGAGFHVTSHLIALAALFIACFAIAGYVSFRDDSIPGKALKDDIDSQSLNLSGVQRRAYSYTYPAVAVVAGDDSIGPFTGVFATDGSNKAHLISVELSQTAAQTTALGGLEVQIDSTLLCTANSIPTAANVSNMLFSSVANTADSFYEFLPLQNAGKSGALGYNETSAQACITTVSGGAVVEGTITVKYVIEHGPGGSFPTPLSGTVEL